MFHVVIRTCDRTSLQSNRIVNKRECIIRCLNSILNNLESITEKRVHIIDDNSSEEFVSILKQMTQPLGFVTLNLLPQRDQSNLNGKQKSRYSVKVAYEYIYSLPDDDLVYIVEDDYLHFPGAIEEMIATWKNFKQTIPKDIGIFPQDFNQLAFHPHNPFNSTYIRPCVVVAGEKRYYRTTWYTHESFMIQSKIFKKYKHHFDRLLTIGDNDANWEGNTISSVWQDDQFLMFMPLGSLVIHLSAVNDIPFYISKEQVTKLWKQNKTIWSSKQYSYIDL